MAPDRKGSDRAESLEAAECRVDEFEDRWWKRHPSVDAGRPNNWKDVIPMFAFAPVAQCLLSKTNAIEILKEPAECHQDTDPVPNDRAASMPLVPALRNLESEWKAALKRLDILSGIGFGRRMSRVPFQPSACTAEDGGGRSDRPPRLAGASGRVSRFRSAACERPCGHLSTSTIMDCRSFGRESGLSRDGHEEECVLIAEPRQCSPGTPWNGPSEWALAV